MGPFSFLTYDLSSRLGEVNEDDLSTLHHTFLDLLLLDHVDQGSSGWGSGEPHEMLLFPVKEFEEYIVDLDAESDFFGSNIDPCPDVS